MVLQLVLILLIVLLNGFFVIAEYGLVRARVPKMEELAEQGNNTAKLALRMLVTKRDTYVSAIQLGVTASTILFGILGGPLLANVLHVYGTMELVLAWLCAFVFVVLLHVVLGELVPRAFAESNVEQALLRTAYPLIFFHYLLYPLVVVSSRASHTVQRLLHIDKPKEDIARSEDELRRIVSASEEGGQIDHMESSIIDNVFDFADRVAREVMIPRQDMVCLFTDDTLAENMETVRNSHHTRYPLCNEDKDQVIGTVHVRDLLDLKKTQNNADLRQLMRPIVVVPEAMPVPKVLQIMKQKKVQMALVADEYGGTAGLITMKDLVEEILGELQDEHEMDEPQEIEERADGSYEFDGMVLLDEITEILGIEFDDPEEDTIGGYVFGLLGRKPEQGDEVELGHYRFKVLEAEGFRVMRVLAVPQPPEPEPEEAEDD